MIRRFATALAFSLALSSIAAPAMAETQFRSAEAQAFSQQDLQRYGLSAADAAQVAAYQSAGYEVQLVTPKKPKR